MVKTHNPPGILAPVGPLSWGLELPRPGRALYLSGLIGTDAEGHTPPGVIDQARQIWRNIGAVLASAGMGPGNIVRTTLYFTEAVVWSEQLRQDFNRTRIEFFGDHRPASTLLFIKALMDPAWLLEIEATAIADL